jgi:asparagine synthase (glutamine-hydrolysing)
VAKLARDHGYKVVLSGLGGDELFGGYPSFHRVRSLHRLGRAIKPWRTLARPLARTWERVTTSGRARRAAAYFQDEPTLSAAYQAVRSIFSPRECAALGELFQGGNRRREFPEMAAVHAEWPGDIPQAVSQLEFIHYLRNQLLRDADVMSMAHGLELRVPLVDRPLFETLRSIPAAIRFQPGKQLLREAAPGLPAWHATQPRRGFELPFGAWLEESWSDLRAEAPCLDAVPLNSWSRAWSLIVLRRWMQNNGIAEGRG